MSVLSSMTAMPRDQRIAHLELHGWRPIKNLASHRAGVYNESLDEGYTIMFAREMPDKVRAINRNTWIENYVPASWADVTDLHLNAFIDPAVVVEYGKAPKVPPL